MSVKTIELVITRDDFYARSYASIKKLISVLLFITLMLIGFAIWQYRSSLMSPKYFPTTPDGRLIISPPNSVNHLLLSNVHVSASGAIYNMPQPTKSIYELQPMGENALVLYWAELAIKYMFNYDYVHYRSVIESSRQFFTPIGHENFIQALVDSKNLETVQARSAVVVPELTGPVKLVKTELFKGRYSWDIEVPVKLTYQSVADADPIVQFLLAKMSIARVSTLITPFYGLSIYSLNFEQVFEPKGAANL